MNSLKKDIFDMCKDFIKIVDSLFEKGEISQEQHNEMVKLKLDYVKKFDK